MTNPYAVLGVSSDATDEQIKSAYRELAQQYSESDYSSDPLSSTADARMGELNAAYDEIMAERRAGGRKASDTRETCATAQASDSYAEFNESASRNYTEIRTMIRGNDLISAEQRLMAVDTALRGAEWNFLMGCVCQSKGWLDEAFRYFSSANSIDPGNSEYTAAYSRMSRERTTGGSSYNPYQQQRTSDCMGDDVCGNACQCMCMYSLCSSCCCGGR
ncbi:MAG: DnaJ domain-containing protein [Oscillospiraceae bacterium]